MKTVQLTTHLVELIENITYGMNEEIKATTVSAMRISSDMASKIQSGAQTGEIKMDGNAIVAGKFKAAELLINKITDLEGKEIKYSTDWHKNLTIADGGLLEDAIDEIKTEKK